MKKITVTIAIPAFNEEKNIEDLLKSIIIQKEEGFVVDQILIILDGSTDNTYNVILNTVDKRIKVLRYKERVGKSKRLNEIFQYVSSEVLILLDADIILSSSGTITNLVAPFVADKTIGLVSGKPLPKVGKSFIERGIMASINSYLLFAETVNNGSNIYACKGVLLGLSKRLYKYISIPNDVFANDAYLYFFCLQKGFKFYYAKSANAWYFLPTTIKDHVQQNLRFIAATNNIKKYFGDAVKKEFNRDKYKLYLFMLLEYIKNPLECSVIFILNLYCKFLVYFSQVKIQSVWVVIESTKKKSFL